MAVAMATSLQVASASADALADAFGAHAKGVSLTVDHSTWSKLLATYVRPAQSGATPPPTLAQMGLNRVDYARFKFAGHSDLKAYLGRLEATDLTKLDRPEQFAFWANLYNAKTIDIVLDKYPVRSIKDISLGGGLLAAVTGGPWKAKVTKVNGIDLSLDDIEHGILRKIFKDPRVHYAVNCASVGCPNLGAEAFTGGKLDAQLDAAAKAYVNSPRGLSLTDGKLTASSIYSWFQADFGGSAAGVLDHVRRYAEPALRRKLESVTSIADYVYDWSLNDAKE